MCTKSFMSIPILTGNIFSLYIIVLVITERYASCVRSCAIYGREIWPMKVEHEMRLISLI